MTALPYYPSSQTIVNQCCTLCQVVQYPGVTAMNVMVMVPQQLNSVGQVGSVPVLKAHGQVPGTTTGQNLFGFVVPPMSQVLAHITGKTTFTSSLPPDDLDAWSFLAGLAGPIIGNHAGTDQDPLALSNIGLFSATPGNLASTPATAMRRLTTANVPIYTAPMDYLNVRFTNTTNDPWFVSPGMGVKDFNTNPAAMLYESGQTMVNTVWYKVLNYVADAILNNIVPAFNTNSNGPNTTDPGFYVSL